MATHLSIATVIEKNRIHSVDAFVVLLEIDVINPATNQLVETLYFARNPEDITYQGKLYTKSNFDLQMKHESGSPAEVSINVHDYTRAVQARMQEYGGGIGFDVRFIVINTGNMTQPPEIMEKLKVIGATANNYNVSFKLGAENPLSLRFPRRIQSPDKCSFQFRSPECGYAGWMTTCDYTLQGDNGCVAHGNTPRYGGFVGINSRGY